MQCDGVGKMSSLGNRWLCKVVGNSVSRSRKCKERVPYARLSTFATVVF